MQEKTFVISLGGSVMVPEEIDEQYLKKFQQFILKKVFLGYKFIIITGGGKICRKYQQALRNVAKASLTNQDWIGIETTKLNALLLKIILAKKSNPLLLDQQGKIKHFGKYPIIVGCGWAPGSSSDFDAAQTAVDFKIKTIINLSNQDFVYTADPKKDQTAMPIAKISWKDYLKLIPKKWTPGMNTPFDPIAANLAMKNNLKVVMANGQDLSNLEKIITNKPFKGTTIY
ncbi:MAG: UMP kinase [Candidatus Pacebacteria bacterium]|nr:UMP kinase [Candidatus Paceibacterota bacterium]